MEDLAVEIAGVSKYYKIYQNQKHRMFEALNPFGKIYHRKFYALNNINLKIKKGEIIGIVGRNGAGKSTLLRLIASITQPSEGTISVDGKLSALLELNGGLNRDFTGIENIFFMGTILGLNKNEIDEKVKEIIDFTELGDFIYQPVRTYSKGMVARLAFGCSISINPDILIVDEILSVGDELFRRKSFAKMEEFFKGGKTIFYVSHNITSIIHLCTRAILMNKGTILLDSTPKVVAEYYQKLMFAKGENLNTVLNEIEALNTNTEHKSILENIFSNEPEIKSIEHEKLQEDYIESKAYFIPDFIPKSTITLTNADVDIFDIMITTQIGNQVNSLIHGEEYIYSYRIKFNTETKRVKFGMRLKTQNGFEIDTSRSQAVNRERKYFTKIKKGDIFTIKWYFKCLLSPGIYFADAEITGIIDDEEILLKGISDCLVFKIQEMKGKNFNGLVNIITDVECSKSN
jgi:lipopolysaccharide transport system ATP-binding protein